MRSFRRATYANFPPSAGSASFRFTRYSDHYCKRSGTMRWLVSESSSFYSAMIALPILHETSIKPLNYTPATGSCFVRFSFSSSSQIPSGDDNAVGLLTCEHCNGGTMSNAAGVGVGDFDPCTSHQLQA